MNLSDLLISEATKRPVQRYPDVSTMCKDSDGVWHEMIPAYGDIYECLTHGEVGVC